MRGGDLLFAHDHDLFGIVFSAGFPEISLQAVADGEEKEADRGEIVAAEIGDVPAELMRDDLTAFRSFQAPCVGRPVGKRGKQEPMLVQKGESLPHDGIHF